MLVTWPMSNGGAALIMSLAPAAWFRFGRGITDAAGAVSQWNDASGNARHLKQTTGTNQPALQADGSILFDGVDNFLKTDPFAVAQPITYYLLMRQVTWTINEYLIDGDIATMAIATSTSTPRISILGSASVAENANLVVNTYAAVCAVFNGAGSVLRVSNTTETTGNVGTGAIAAVTLGAAGNATAFSNIQVKEVIVFPAAHNLATRDQVIAYLLTL